MTLQPQDCVPVDRPVIRPETLNNFTNGLLWLLTGIAQTSAAPSHRPAHDDAV